MNKEEWMLLKEDELIPCACCKCEGIPIDVSDDGDEDHTEILETQHDGDSKYHKEYLCSECMTRDDYRIQKWNKFAEDHNRYPAPYEM